MGSYKLIRGSIWQGSAYAGQKADALLIRDDRIAAVGDFRDLRKMIPMGSSIQEFDAGDHTVLPGISDSHIHLLAYAKWKLHVNLGGASTFREAVDLLLKEKERLPKGAWINGVNYDETLWPDNNMPTKRDLDEFFQDNPVLLDKADGHKHIANSLALRISGVDKIESPHIPRDENGECIGILNESAAAPLIAMISKETETRAKLKAGLKSACDELAGCGVTSIHDCDAAEYGLEMKASLYQELIEENKLHVRVNAYHDKLPSFDMTSGYGNDMLCYAGFKIFADGATTARTAAMSEPYEDKKTTCGVFNHSDEEMYDLVKYVHVRGIQCQIHAIGDAAIGQILNAIEKVSSEYGEPRLPYRINHCTVTTEAVREKLKQLKVVIDLQPAHLYYVRRSYPIRLGKRRCFENAYCFRSLFETGCLLTGGCDAPATTLDVNPWFGIWVLCNRTDLNGADIEYFDPTQILSLKDALDVFIYNPWAAIGKGTRFGRLAPGYKADVAILDRDIFAIPAPELKDVKNTATFLNGNLVAER